MNKIRRYRPAFFEGYEEETVEFSTLEELLNIKWVKGFTKRDDFHRFALSDSDNLMATYKHGYEWWVVGTIEDPEGLDLPKHVYKKLKQA